MSGWVCCRYISALCMDDDGVRARVRVKVGCGMLGCWDVGCCGSSGDEVCHGFQTPLNVTLCHHSLPSPIFPHITSHALHLTHRCA